MLVQKCARGRPRRGTCEHMPLIATDSRSEHAWGKLKRRPLTVCLRMKLSLKYQLQVDSVHSASDRMEAVFLSSVMRLHCYVCLASACLARIFVLMWTQLYISLCMHFHVPLFAVVYIHSVCLYTLWVAHFRVTLYAIAHVCCVCYTKLCQTTLSKTFIK